MLVNAVRSRSRSSRALAVAVVAIGLSAMSLEFTDAQAPPELQLDKSIFGGLTVVEPGEPFLYLLAYTCSSILTNCTGAQIADDLPPELDLIGITPTPQVVNVAVDTMTNEITFTFVDPLPAGSTGILQVEVRVKPGTLPGIVVQNTAEFTASNAPPTTSNTVPVTTDGSFDMTPTKSLVGEAVAGFPTTFQLQVCPTYPTGAIAMESPIFTDTLPAAATFVTAQGTEGVDWVYDAMAHTVTFINLPTVPADGCLSRTVTVIYDTIPPGVQTNTFDSSGTPQGCSDPMNLAAWCGGQTARGLGPADESFSVIAPYAGASATKSSDSDSTFAEPAPGSGDISSYGTQILAGERVTYTVDAENTAYITMTNATITDEIPPEVVLNAWTLAPVTDAAVPGATVSGFYQRSDNPPGVWVPLPGNPYGAPTTITVASLGLPPGVLVTDLRWDIGMLVPQSQSWSATISTTSLVTLTPGTVFTNCASFRADYIDGGPQVWALDPCSDVEVVNPRAIPRVGKTNATGPFIPGAIVTFDVDASNAVEAHLPISNIVMADLLPAELTYIPGSFAFVSGPPGAPAPNVEVINNYGGTGRTLLRWSWTDQTGSGGTDARYILQPGQRLTIRYQAQIVDQTEPDRYFNKAAIVDFDGPPNVLGCNGSMLYTDTNDLDGDGNSLETSCQNSNSQGFVDVGIFLQMTSEKFVRGQLDTGFSKMGLTIPGGDAEYKLVITNTSNISVSHIAVVDILPYIGDTGVIVSTPRESDWRPNLQGPVVGPPGVPLTVYYSTEQNPCRPEVLASGPPGCSPPFWTTIPPADITSVQSLRFVFCTYDIDGNEIECLFLPVDGSLELSWPMVAPNNAPTHPSCLNSPFDPAANPDCQIAWNSFGFTAGGGGLQLRPAEPIRVGLRVADSAPAIADIGDYVFLDVAGQQNDGIQQPQERGINGVRVELWRDPDGIPGNGDEVFVDYRITGPDHLGNPGYYLFPDIPADDYFIRFFPPSGYTPSLADQGGNDALDSDGVTPGVDGTYGPYVQTADFALGATDVLTIDQGLWLPTDYGDAPAGYPVEAASQAVPADAARHIIVSGIRLGANEDAELDGQPSLTALGDDVGGTPDDEDGVLFGDYIGTAAQPSGILTIGQANGLTVSATISATVAGRPVTSGFLNAWIDFNADGDWDDPGEQIAVNTPVSGAGATVPLSVVVPPGAVPGTTYARFRLSTEPGLTPYGTAYDGEVEDYQVQLVSPPAKSLVATSEAHTSDVGPLPVRVVVGEIVRYRQRVSVPEGTLSNFRITDTLPAGMLYLADGTASVAFTADTSITSAPLTVVPAVGGTFVNGTDPVFVLGTVVNNDVDTGEEFVDVSFNALVLNVTGNQAAGDRSNTFQVSYGAASFPATPAVTVRIAEPSVTLAKNVTTTPLDAGDTVVYQLVATAGAGTNNTTAFNVRVTDLIDANFVLQSVATAAPGGAVVTDSSSIPGNSVDVLIDRLLPGEVATVTITAVVAAAAPSGLTIPNTGRVVYTSLPVPSGTAGNPTGSTVPGGSGAADGERNGADGPGGALNDYAAAASRSVTLVGPTVDKRPPTPSSYTIGEVVDYSILVTLAEGTTRGLVVTDALPTGMALVASQVITSAALSGGLLAADYAGGPLAPTVNGAAGDGNDVALTFGDVVTTADNVTTNNAFVVRISARVLNVLSNQAGVTRSNTGSLRFTDPETGATTVADPTPETITIIEPVLAIDKTITVPPSPADAGGLVTYSIVINHAPTSGVNAYDAVLVDPIPAGLINAVVLSVVVSPGFGGPAPSSEIVAGSLRVPTAADGSFDLPLGESVTVTLQAEIDVAVIAGDPITNRASVTWTSLNGPSADERTSGNGLLGGGGLNDYEVTDPVAFNVDLPAIDKRAPTPASATIGQSVTYDIVVTLPEGTTPSLVVIDALPSGLALTASQVITMAALSGGLLTSDYAGSPLAPTVNTAAGDGNDIALAFGTVVTAADNLVANNRFVVRLTCVVRNILTNQDGVSLQNRASLTYTNGAGGPVTVADPQPEAVQVIEPVLAIDKALVGPPSMGDAGDIITYTLTLAHAPSSHAPAYDVVITDVIPGGLINPVVLSVTVSPGFGGPPPSSEIVAGQVRVPATADGTFDLPSGESITVTLQAEIGVGVAPGQTVTNTGVATWTSRDGTNPDERTSGDGPLGGGGLNDYEVSDGASLMIDGEMIGKALEMTSAGHTLGTNVTVGEIVTYVLSIALPEGMTPSLVVTDFVPIGMALHDWELVTTAAASGGLLAADFNGTLPAPTVASAGGSGDDVTFTFGAITVAADNNAANNTFLIRIGTRVLNIPSNVGVAMPGIRTMLSNTAQAQVNGNPPTVTEPVIVTVAEPRLVITKAITPSAARPNDTVTITLNVTNTGTSTAFDMVVDDPLPNSTYVGHTNVSASPGFSFSTVPSGANTIVRYSGGSLAAGASATFVFTVDVALGAAAGPPAVVNVATITQATTLDSTNPTDGVDAEERDEPDVSGTDDFTVLRPDLVTTKTNGVVRLIPSQHVTYSILVRNVGNGVAYGVVITDTVPAGTTFDAPPSTPTWSCADGAPAGTACTYPVGTLLPGASTTVIFGAEVDAVLPDSTTAITNTAAAFDDGSAGADPTPANNTDPEVDPVQRDWGDLPDGPYATLLASDGARHFIDGTTFLGAGVDAEGDGQPNANASGDDAAGAPDDEDGVTFLTPLMPGQPAQIQVVASTAGYLNAWIDYNSNGVFDAGEQIATDLALVAGPNVINIASVPADATGTMYSRFRFTSVDTGGTLGPDGIAPDGEVEDYVLLSLGNTVWLDNGAGGGGDTNGVRDGTEAGIPGVVVQLYAAGDTPGVDTPLATTTTDANGNYLFTGLVPGSYVVHIPASEFQPGEPLANARSSFGVGDPNDPFDEGVDENGIDNASPGTNGISTGAVTLTVGGEPTGEDGNANSNLTVDFAFFVLPIVGDRVWYDVDNDGVQDPGEPGLSGVTVTLRADDDGTPGPSAGDSTFGTRVTGVDGIYIFSGIPTPSGPYYVVVDASTLPGGMVTSPGTVNPGAVFPLPSGSVLLDKDFGFTGTGSIGSMIWDDANGNGVRDPGELGIPGVWVTLTGTLNGVPFTLTVVTGMDGSYRFDNLPAGSYTITVDPATLPPGMVPTYDYDGTGTPNSAAVVLNPGQSIDLVDFGFALDLIAGSSRAKLFYDPSDPDDPFVNNRGGLATLRVYGLATVCDPNDPGQGNRPATGGSNSITDTLTGRVPEDPPYTDPEGPFSPLSGEAPEQDYVTWNPAWISERLGDPALGAWGCANGIDEVSAGSNIRVGGVNGSEKVWLRHWYEPTHLDKDLNADDCLTDANGDGVPDAPVNPGGGGRPVDEWYPAIVSEQTYMLLDNDLPQPDPSPRNLAGSAPRPACGPAGQTRFVFPIGVELPATDPLGTAVGYGLTSLDADFDGAIDMVNVTSEALLAGDLNVDIDFDGDGALEPINPDGAALSCDEMVVLHTDSMTIGLGGAVQFLDHFVRLRSASSSSAVLEVWYSGDLVPRLVQARSVAIGGVALAGDVGPLTVLPPGGSNVGVVPVGAWFVQVLSVDPSDGTATVTVGRALGATCASMESAPFVANRTAGGPWFLKRFYVDGHEYNTVAIMTCGTDALQYITLRSPQPKVPVTIEQHSVRLQPYRPLDGLALAPPFNHEHTILEDVRRLNADGFEPCPILDGTEPVDRPDILYMGGPIGPVSPVLGLGDPTTYVGRNPNAPVGPYDDPAASRWLYVQEGPSAAHAGQLAEKYGAVSYDPQCPPPGPGVPDSFFYNEQILTQPFHYTEFILPNRADPPTDPATGRPPCDPDRYLMTSSLVSPAANWRLWTMPNGPVPATIPPIPPDLTTDATGVDPTTGLPGAPRRVSFTFDPDEGDPMLTSANGVRLMGGATDCVGADCGGQRPSLGQGAGNTGVVTDVVGGFPVEVLPYTDPFAPFNPQHPDAPRNGSLTVNPAVLNEFQNFGEPLATLYPQISSGAMNAYEKVYHRLWYEPDYITKIRNADDCDFDLRFPAVMQEYTYLMMDTTGNPAAVPPGDSRIAFPIGTRADELPKPNANGTLPAGGTFGYGLTTFDADFDGVPETVTVHSEQTINTLFDTTWQSNRPTIPGFPLPPLPGPILDLDGDGVEDDLDADCTSLNGNEMVILAATSITLDRDPATTQPDSAMLLDHLVTLSNITSNGRAQLRFFFTGGTVGAARPEAVRGVQTLRVGDAAIVDRFQDRITIVAPGATNLGVDGGWFAFVEDVSDGNDSVTLTIGRALGATHSAIDNGASQHDLQPGDPWYLKRFYVDGHEYNVVALMTRTPAGADPLDPTECNTDFAFLTIRTPVPKGNFFNPQDSLFQQGYFLGGQPPAMSVMPPFNVDHTVATDITRIDAAMFGDVDGFTECTGPLAAAGPLSEVIRAELPEPRLGTELLETFTPALDGAPAGWQTHQVQTNPTGYTEVGVPEGQVYLLTLPWRARDSQLAYYGCTRAEPGPFSEDDPPPLSQAVLSDVATCWRAGIIAQPAIGTPIPPYVGPSVGADPGTLPTAVAPSQTPTRTATPTLTATRTRTATITATPTRTATPTASPTASRTPTPTTTLSATPTGSATATSTRTPTGTLTPSTATPTASATSTATPTTAAAAGADLSLIKVPGVTTPAAGTTLNYVIVVTNNGPSGVAAFTVIDALPAGTTYAGDTAASIGGSCNAATPPLVICSFGALPNGGVRVFTLSAAISPSLPPGTMIQNVATVIEGGSGGILAASTAAGTLADPGSILRAARAAGNDPRPDNDEGRASVVVVGVADLAVSGTGSPDPVTAGSLLTRTLRIANAGPSDAADVRLADPLPAGTRYVSSTGAACTGVAPGQTGDLRCAIGRIAARGAAVMTVVLRVDPALADASPIGGAARVEAPGTTDPRLADNLGGGAVSSTTLADLALVRTGPATVTPGQPFEWRLVVTNDGPSDAVGIVLQHGLPSGIVFESASDAACAVGPPGTVTCRFDRVPADGAREVVLRVRVAPDAPDGASLDAAATVRSDTPESSPADNTVPADASRVVVERMVDLVLDKVALGAAVAGGRIGYRLTVANLGPSAATSVVLVDRLPDGTQLTNGPAGCAVAPGAREVRCALADLGVGGASQTVLELSLDDTLGAGAALVNTARVTSTGTDIHPSDNEARSSVPIERHADLAVHVVSPGQAEAGTSVEVGLTVANSGPSTALAAELAVLVPDGMRLIGDVGGCAVRPDGSLRCALGDIPVGATVRRDLRLAIDAAVLDGTALMVRGSGWSATTDPSEVDNDAAAVIRAASRAQLSLVKTAARASALAGESVDFELTVRNAGPSVARSVELLDVPAGGLAMTASGACALDDDGSVVCQLGDLAPGASGRVVLRGTFDPNLGDGAVVNAAEVRAESATPARAQASVIVAANADLSVALNVPAMARPGAQVEHVVDVVNDGPSTARAAVLRERLPAQTRFVSASDVRCAAALGIVTCPLGDVSSGESRRLVIVLAVDSGAPDGAVLAAEAEVSSATADAVAANNRADGITTVALPDAADLAIAMTSPSSAAAAGGEVEFRLTVTNEGPRPVAGVVVDDLLPPGLTFVEARDGACVPRLDGVLACALGDLAVGAVVDLTVVARIDASVSEDAVLINRASVRGGRPDPVATNNAAEAEVTVSLSADVRVALSTIGAPAPAVAGRPLDYRVDVVNDGPSPAAGAAVSVELPTGVVYRSDDGACDRSALPILRCSVGDLASGAARRVTIRVDLPSDAPLSALVARAVGTATTADPVPANNTATAISDVVGEANLMLDKRVLNGARTPGAAVSFTLAVTNTGPSDALGVVLIDDLPAGLTYVSDGRGCETSGLPALRCPLGRLPAGGSAAVTVVARVDSAAAAGSVLENRAHVAGTTSDPQPADNSDSVAVTVTPEVDLVVEQTAIGEVVTDGDPPGLILQAGAVTAGRRVSVRLRVTNRGPSPATSVTLADTLPAGMTLHDAGGAACAASDAGVVTCGLGTIAAGAAVETILVLDVAPDVTNDARPVNEAWADAAEPEHDAGDNLSRLPIAVGAVADLDTALRFDSPSAQVGARVGLTATVHNGGPSRSADASVTLSFPAGMTPVDVAAPCSRVAGVVVCALGAVAPGSEGEIRLTVRLDGDGGAGAREVTATSAAGTHDPRPANNTARAVLTARPVVELSLSLVAAAERTVAGRPPRVALDAETVTAGRGLTLTLHVANDGAFDASGVVVTSTLPAGVTLVGADIGCASDRSGVVACPIGDVRAGGAADVRLRLAVAPDVVSGGALRFAGMATANEPDSAPEDNDAERAVSVDTVADLALAASASTAVVAPGGWVTVTMTAANIGPSDAHGPSLELMLPDGLTFVNATAGCVHDGQRVSCALNRLAPGAAIARLVVARVADAASGRLAFGAALNPGAVADPDDTNNAADVSIDVFAPVAPPPGSPTATPVPPGAPTATPLPPGEPTATPPPPGEPTATTPPPGEPTASAPAMVRRVYLPFLLRR